MLQKLLASALLLITALAPAGFAAAASQDGEYNSVVKLIESYYHVKHKGMPVLARLGMKVARSSEVKNFKLAMFEDQDFSNGGGVFEFSKAMRNTLRAEWSPLVRTLSQKGAEQSYIYFRVEGDNFKVLIVNIERRDATVLQVEVSPQAFAKLLNDPDKMGKTLTDQATSDN